MTDMREALTASGIAADRIHTELFGALAADQPRRCRTDRPSTSPAGGSTWDRTAGDVRPQWYLGSVRAASNLLELAEACDVPTRWSCRTGVCHTCVTPLLSGEVTYSPTPLEPAPDGQALICCARPTTDVVLDM